MLEIIERAISHIPNYLVDLGQLLSSPRKFVGARNMNSRTEFERSMLFAGITIGILIATSMLIARFEPDEILNDTVGTILGFSIDVCLISLATVVAWRVVGWRAPPLAVFTVVTYYSAVTAMIARIGMIVQIGILRITVPDYVDSVLWAGKSHQGDLRSLWVEMKEISQGREGLVLLTSVANLAAILVMLAWGIAAWSAFQDMNGLTRTRSMIALSIVLFLFLPVFGVSILFMAAIF